VLKRTAGMSEGKAIHDVACDTKRTRKVVKGSVWDTIFKRPTVRAAYRNKVSYSPANDSDGEVPRASMATAFRRGRPWCCRDEAAVQQPPLITVSTTPKPRPPTRNSEEPN